MDQPHSGPGIASFILALLSAAAFFVAIGIGVVLENQAGGMSEDSPVVLVVGLALIGALGVLVLSFVLGVTGLFQSNRNKIFAILGVILSLLTFVAGAGLIVLGMMMPD